MLHEPPPERKPDYIVSLIKPRVEHLPFSETHQTWNKDITGDQNNVSSLDNDVYVLCYWDVYLG